MKIKSIIVDDEAKLRKVLEMKLKRHCPEIDVVGVAENAEEAYGLISKLNPELVFLDIAMPGQSGFELLDRFHNKSFEVIFVTGFDSYVLRALRVSAVDYLLKPLVTKDLVTAVEKAKLRIEKQNKTNLLDILKHNVSRVGNQDSKIVIPGSSAYEFVRIKDIVHCEGWQKYTKIHLENQQTLVSSYNIGVFKEMLNDYGFYSVHKSHLINTTHILRYTVDGTLLLTHNATVPVSRRRREDFIRDIIKNQYCIEK